jgi:enoyl-CoA hydratase/carnithine racemase
MKYQKVIVEAGPDFIGGITLNRPEHLNALDSLMARELHEALLELDGDRNVRVVLLKGAGKSFCVGIDINESPDKTAMEYRTWIERMELPLMTIAKMKKPVIAQVQGVAAANGMGLAVAADLVIASEDARMGLTAINVGLNCIGPVIPVARCVGRKKALELLFYGRLISAPEALSLGLVNKVVPADELGSESLRWAKELAAKSPVALQIAKSAFYHAEDMEYEKQFAYMNEAFARLCTTEDAKEGVQAFLAKRKPDWKER